MTESDNEKLIKIEKYIEQNKEKIDRDLERLPIIETHRKQKPLYCIPPDIDFTIKDGNTEYEVVGHFYSDTDEFLLNKIIRQLGYSEMD